MDHQSEAAPYASLGMITEQRREFFYQVPAVRIHPAVLQTLNLPPLTLIRVSLPAVQRFAAAWAIADETGTWESCPTPWHRTAQLSAATWRDLDARPRSGEYVEIAFPTHRLPVRPARTARLIDADELSLHRHDARNLGLEEWAFVNYRGVPAALRVDISDDDRDRGVARLSFRTRLLLGVPKAHGSLSPDLLIAPLPAAPSGQSIALGEPQWEKRPGQRNVRALLPLEWLETLARWLLRAPTAALQTVEASPGEDQALTVRLPAGLFPILGTNPGQQVYVSWGRRNRALATALEAESDKSAPQEPDVQMVGRRPENLPVVPESAQIQIGAQTRAALGIPRVAVVTVRRRVTSLVLARLNQLLIPATGFFIALAAKVHMDAWELTLAIVVIGTLLLAPLRVRANPRGRIR